MTRRRKIAALSVTLLIALCWFLWPRADGRFVGRWTLQEPGDTKPTDDLEFRRSGFLVARDIDTGESYVYMRWRVEDDNLVVGESEKPGLLLKTMASLFYHADRSLVIDQHGILKIVSVEADEITLQQAGSSEVSRMVRKK